MSLKGQNLESIKKQEKINKQTRNIEDSKYEDLHKSMGPGKYQLFNEFPMSDFKKNWVGTETDLKNLHCPDTYLSEYNKCLQKVDMSTNTPYYHVQPYYSGQDHTLLTDDNKRLKGPVNPRQDYAVLKYNNKLNPNHYQTNSVLSFKDKYQNKFQQKLQQQHPSLENPIWNKQQYSEPLVNEQYTWQANGKNYSYTYNVHD